MTRKDRKGYFYEEQEQAVKDYLLSDNKLERDMIFNKTLMPAFTKMVESIIRRYNLHIPNEEFEDTFNDTISFLMSKIEHFDPEKINANGKNFKAYSYCGTVCKNYLLHKRIEYSKELDRASSYDDMCDEINNDEKYSTEEETIDYSFTDNIMAGAINSIKEIIENDSDNILTENEILVGNALINLLENWDFILTEDGSNKLNKSMVLYYLREATRLSTKEIRASMKKYKKAYYIKKEEIIKENNF